MLVGFQVNFNIAEFANQYLVQSELRKRIVKRLPWKRGNLDAHFRRGPYFLKRRTRRDSRAGIWPAALAGAAPGRALDLACGSGRNARWLIERGWNVTAVDIETPEIPGARCLRADLERHEYRIEPDVWDLYRVPTGSPSAAGSALPEIAGGVREGGIVALAGKTTGRFATSLDQYRKAFPEWGEIASGENEARFSSSRCVSKKPTTKSSIRFASFA